MAGRRGIQLPMKVLSDRFWGMSQHALSINLEK
jgi:hypothetical protein